MTTRPDRVEEAMVQFEAWCLRHERGIGFGLMLLGVVFLAGR
jgi:hypothetical protein